MLLKLILVLLFNQFRAALIKREKTSFNFTDLYGSEYGTKSKGYTWIGSIPLSEADYDSESPANTYRGTLTDDGDAITVKSLCEDSYSETYCKVEKNGEYRTAEKVLFKRSELSDENKLLIEGSSRFELSADMDIIAFRVNYEKQWRHSYKSSYVLFKTKYFGTESAQEYIDTVEDVWFFSFEPRPIGLRVTDGERRKFVYVEQDNNLYYGKVEQDGKTTRKPMPNGDDATADNGILNGVPDWVYEEEMLSSRSATWWSPNGDNVVFVKFNTSMETNVDFDYYGSSADQRKRADDFTIKSMDDRYPRKQSIPYSKPGGQIASYQVYFCNLD